MFAYPNLYTFVSVIHLTMPPKKIIKRLAAKLAEPTNKLKKPRKPKQPILKDTSNKTLNAGKLVHMMKVVPLQELQNRKLMPSKIQFVDAGDEVFQNRGVSKDVDAEEELIVQTRKQYEEFVDSSFKMGTGFGPTMPQAHFTWVMIARRFSGKSTLLNCLVKRHFVTKRIKNDELVVSDLPFFSQIIFASPTAGLDKTIDLSDMSKIIKTKDEMCNWILDRMQNPNGVSTLLILDDVQRWFDYSANSVMDQFATVNRHFQVSIIISAQNLRQALSPSLRNNWTDFTTFCIPLEVERKKMQEDIGSDFNKFYDMVDWDIPHQYMHIKITSGPVLWYFQGLSEKQELTYLEKTNGYPFRWKLLGTDN